MENLTTWRALHSLRYCPITLIQTVFAAGTVYLLAGTQAISRNRIVWKEVDHSAKKLDCIMDYLQEIGASWQCAADISGILKELMQVHRRVLDGKPMNIYYSLKLSTADDGVKDSAPRSSSSGSSSVTLVDHAFE